MIIKSLSIKSLDGLEQAITYILQGKNHKDDHSHIILDHLRSHDAEGWVQEFMKNEKYRKRKAITYGYQEILSYAKADKAHISVEKMYDLAQEYIKRRTGNQAIAIGVPHTDQEHFHFHFILSSIQYRTGRSTRISQKDFQLIKQDIQALQMERYPELVHSVVNHRKQKKSDERKRKNHSRPDANF